MMSGVSAGTGLPGGGASRREGLPWGGASPGEELPGGEELPTWEVLPPAGRGRSSGPALQIPALGVVARDS